MIREKYYGTNEVLSLILLLCISLLEALDQNVMEWNLQWSDEFDKCPGGKPDPENWEYEKGFVRNEELQWYQPDNAYCSGGHLIIDAQRVSNMPNPNYDPHSTDWKKKRKWINYTSSSLNTHHKHDFTYGRFEIRAKIDIRQGSWPAWWALGTKGSWPECGEIDMMEYYKGKVLANFDYADKQGQSVWSSKTKLVDSTWAASFHNWTMIWDNSTIKLQLDGKLMNSFTISTADSGHKPNPWRGLSQYLLVNQAIGGKNGGDPSHTTFPIRYELDYVRVYSLSRNSLQACHDNCVARHADGCCQHSAEECSWISSGYVDGSSHSPNTYAANCNSAGKCDSWNKDEKCEK